MPHLIEPYSDAFKELVNCDDIFCLDSGPGDVLTMEHIQKAIEILDKHGELPNIYYVSPNLKYAALAQ